MTSRPQISPISDEALVAALLPYAEYMVERIGPLNPTSLARAWIETMRKSGRASTNDEIIAFVVELMRDSLGRDDFIGARGRASEQMWQGIKLLRGGIRALSPEAKKYPAFAQSRLWNEERLAGLVDEIERAVEMLQPNEMEKKWAELESKEYREFRVAVETLAILWKHLIGKKATVNYTKKYGYTSAFLDWVKPQLERVTAMAPSPHGRWPNIGKQGSLIRQTVQDMCRAPE